MAGQCEDYPCCGHTPENPCERQWYDEPGAFDTSRPGNEHALCDHENGICEVEEYDNDDDEAEYEAEQDEAQQLHDEMINDKLIEDGRWG
jgi:hypothetical protein